MKKILLVIIAIVFGGYLVIIFKGSLLIKRYVNNHKAYAISENDANNDGQNGNNLNLRPTPAPKDFLLVDSHDNSSIELKKSKLKKKIKQILDDEEEIVEKSPKKNEKIVTEKSKPKKSIKTVKELEKDTNENDTNKIKPKKHVRIKNEEKEKKQQNKKKYDRNNPQIEIEESNLMNIEKGAEDNRTRVFCLIKSYLKSYRSNKTTLVYSVWGRKCDEHRVIMMIPEEFRTPDWKPGQEFEVLGKPFNILQPKTLVEATHAKVTDKIYHTFISIYKRFPNYAWYYLVDDDTYVNMNNLKEFLMDKDSSEPITYGFNFRVIVEDGYHSGGTGYAISNEAFRRIGRKLKSKYSYCKNTGTDDVDVNDCLRSLGTKMGRSVDDFGRQKFLVVGMMAHFYGHYPDWLYDYTMYPISKGYSCCSDSIIAVHYMNPKEVLRLDIAIEAQNNILNMYKKHLKFKKKITFKDIIMTYIALEDFEFGSDYRLKSFLKVKIKQE